jgi:hypothetical protein
LDDDYEDDDSESFVEYMHVIDFPSYGFSEEIRGKQSLLHIFPEI